MKLILPFSILGFTMTSTEAIQQMLVVKWVRFPTWMLKFPELLLLLIMSYLQGVVLQVKLYKHFLDFYWLRMKMTSSQ